MQQPNRRAYQRRRPLMPIAPRTPAPPLQSAPRDDLLDLLPPPACTLGALLARVFDVEGDDALVYLLRAPNGNEPGSIVYVGKSGLSAWERMRRHCSKRRAGTEVSAVDNLIGALPFSRQWTYAAAPPAVYVPFLVAALARMRDEQRALGALKAGLDGRLEKLLAEPERWATARIVEWALIAIISPLTNVKGRVYEGRPLHLLKRFAVLAGQEARKA
jgi:hypothetical protein